jgi:hypothetical protein
MVKITRAALTLTNVVADLVMQLRALGARFREFLIAHHCAALVALVEKAEADAAAAHRAVDRMVDRAMLASIRAEDVARQAAAEAANHGVDLEV